LSVQASWTRTYAPRVPGSGGGLVGYRAVEGAAQVGVGDEAGGPKAVGAVPGLAVAGTVGGGRRNCSALPCHRGSVSSD
jgi:hypothetical protein